MQNTVKITCSDPFCPVACRVFVVNRTPRAVEPDLLMALDMLGDCYTHGLKLDWAIAGCPIDGAVVMGLSPASKYPSFLPMFFLEAWADFDDLPIEQFLRWGRSRRGQRFFSGLVRRVGGKMLRLDNHLKGMG